jgi:hypothetical protein
MQNDNAQQQKSLLLQSEPGRPSEAKAPLPGGPSTNHKYLQVYSDIGGLTFVRPYPV